MFGLFNWWRERKLRRETEAADDAFRARVSKLALVACRAWQMPCVFVDERGARIVDHPTEGPAVTVADFGWPDAVDKLEMFVYAKMRESDQA